MTPPAGPLVMLCVILIFEFFFTTKSQNASMLKVWRNSVQQFSRYHVNKAKSTGVRLAKNDFGSVFGFGFTKLTAASVFGSVFCTVCCLMCMTLEMTYFCAELVQLIVSRSDSELEVQRYGRKKNTLTVDPIMLEDE